MDRKRPQKTGLYRSSPVFLSSRIEVDRSWSRSCLFRQKNRTGPDFQTLRPYINQHHQQYQNPTLPPSAPVQYIYYVPQPVQTPSPSPTIPVPKTLPTVSHVPVLTNKADFFAWDEGVTSLLRANGLIGHILDSADPVDPTRPDCVPRIMPVLPLSPTPADIACLTCWWDGDNIAQHILTSRIGSVPRGLLPS